MPMIRLRSPLRELAGGGSHEVEGSTVAEVVRRLETEHPGLVGWILDERGSVRSHVALFGNGARVEQDTPIGPRDRVDVMGRSPGGGGG